MAETPNAQPAQEAPEPLPMPRPIPTGYVLFMRDNTAVLRCLSDSAVDGFYNVDRIANPHPHQLQSLRQYAQAIAQRYRVPFEDQTMPRELASVAKPRKPRRVTAFQGMSESAAYRRAKRLGYVMKRSDQGYVVMRDGVTVRGPAELPDIIEFLRGIIKSRAEHDQV